MLNNDLKQLLAEQERRLYALLKDVDNKEAELRTIYNTPLGQLLKTYKDFKKSLKQKKKAKKNNYQLWLKLYDTLTQAEKNSALSAIKAMDNKPLFSIIMPIVLENSTHFFEQSLQSVQAQLYPNWELCITVNKNLHPSTLQIVENYAALDSRIVVISNDRGNSKAEAGNHALNHAAGQYITILNPADTLSPMALFYFIKAIMRHPESVLLYSDEDTLNEQCKRELPCFKPDFNYDLLLSQNMIGHLCVYSTSTAKAVGGFQPALEGAEEYDLTLRVIEQVHHKYIHHIPRILYHKRTTHNNASTCVTTHNAHLLAVNNHFKRREIEATAVASQEVTGCNRIRYTLPCHQPSVDIIIPTKNMAHLLKVCILTILAKTTYSNYSITIIDNGSTEEATLSLLAQWQKDARIRVIRDNETPFNYSILNNKAVKSSEAEYICLMNNDIEILTPEWLNEMMGHALQPGVGAVGARLWYPNATIQHAGVVLGIKTGTGHAQKNLKKGETGYCGRGCLQQNFSAVTGACLLVSKKNYFAVNGLNEKELTIGFNDIDLCLKLQEKGLRNIWTPYAEMFHYESVSRGRDNTPQKKERAKQELQYMQKKWAKIIQHDPAYNPNLTIAKDDFSLAWPPRLAHEAEGVATFPPFPTN